MARRKTKADNRIIDLDTQQPKKRAAKKGVTVVTPLTGTLIIDPPTGDAAHRAAWDAMWDMLVAKCLPYVLEMARAEQTQAD